MKRTYSVPRWLLLTIIMSFASAAVAQKSGGTLRAPLRENPGSASILEESSIVVNQPFMPVFNNLVIFNQKERVVSPESIVPDLATEWSWSPDHTVLTMKLRQGVKWHDGKPFSSADVKCTWDMIQEKRTSNWRKNTRKGWYTNLKETSVAGPYEVRFSMIMSQVHWTSALVKGLPSCHLTP